MQKFITLVFLIPLVLIVTVVSFIAVDANIKLDNGMSELYCSQPAHVISVNISEIERSESPVVPITLASGEKTMVIGQACQNGRFDWDIALSASNLDIPLGSQNVVVRNLNPDWLKPNHQAFTIERFI